VEVLCMRSRIKRADAVYLVLDEVSLEIPEAVLRWVASTVHCQTSYVSQEPQWCACCL
jgi:hypothetical protein